MSDYSKESASHRKATFRQYLAAIVANISAFSVGNVIGWTSPMQPLLSSKHPPIGTEPVSLELISWLGSIIFLSAILSSFVWGILSDRLGRKYTAMITAVPFMIGWVLILTAQNVWWLLVARFILGLSYSGTMINIPIYVAEIAEDKRRGSLGAFISIFSDAGVFFSDVVGVLTSYHTLAAMCLSVSIIYLVGISFLPESPVYLWTKGKRDKSEKSLLWFRGGNHIQTIKEFDAFQVTPSSNIQTPSLCSLFKSKGVRKAMIISIGLGMGLQLCGFTAILTYTVKIFQDSGSSLSAYNSMIVVGVMQVSSAFASSALVDRVGRRILLLSAYMLMFLSMTILGSYLYFKTDSWYLILRWIPILSISIFVISYSMGVSPVSIVVMNEIFPPNISGFALSRILLLNTACCFLVVKTFPFLSNLLGSHGLFLLYAFVCLVLFVFIFMLVPETKGKPLQVILRKLNGEDTTEIVKNETSELIDAYKS